jgi:hypothetical protein
MGTATDTQTATRGSSAISEEMFGKPSEVSKQALKQLLDIGRANGVTLEGWWTHGKPAIEAVRGVLHVKPDVAGEIFRRLVTVDKVPLRVEGFPLGIINPELIELRFSTPGSR